MLGFLNTATTASTKRRKGKAKMTLMIQEMKSSTFPPKYPARAPRGTPSKSETNVEKMPI